MFETTITGFVNPYPGTASFGDSDQHRQVFHGRTQEQRDLLNLVLLNPHAVLFSRSGMGKSSLIQAGLMEPLRAQGYFPVVTRVNGALGPVRSIIEMVREACRQSGVALRGEGPEDSLWSFFCDATFEKEGKPQKFVLIIDQFEELFTVVEAAARPAFTEQLADLVRQRVPDAVRRQHERRLQDLRADLREADEETKKELDAQRVEAERFAYGQAVPRVKVLLAFREDYLAEMYSLANSIPTIMRFALRLGPLSLENARRAIVEPSKAIPGSTFGFDEQVVDEILRFLSERKVNGKVVRGDTVDPFQLQILCRRLNERRARARKATISMEQLGGNRGMGKRIRAYYREVCRSIPVVRPGWNARKWRLSATNFVLFNLPRLAARQLCEQGLLILPAGFRNTLAEIVIGRHYGVGTRDLTRLTDRKLLRMEPRLGNQRFYEISHDSLVPTLNEARFTRRVGSIAALAVLVFALPLYHLAESRYEEWQEAVEAQRHAEETERTADQLERQIAAWQAQTAAPGSAERADDWSIALTTYRDLDIEPERRQRNLQELADRLRAALNDTSLNDAQRELAVKRYAALPIELRPAESKLVNEEKAKSKLSFSKVELQGRLNFEGVTLADISFAGARLDNCNERRVARTEAGCSNFERAQLMNIDFSTAHVRQANFRHATIRNSSFVDTEARAADFSGGTLKNVLFARSRLHDGVLRGATLDQTRFLQSQLEQASFERATLHEAEFFASSLRFSSFKDAAVASLRIIESDVEGADFGGVETRNVNFSGTAWWLASGLSVAQQRDLMRRFPVMAYAKSEDYRSGVRSRQDGFAVAGSRIAKATALNGLAWYRATRGADLPLALDEIDAALRDMPGEPALLDTRALVLMQQKRFSEALEALAMSLGLPADVRTVDRIRYPVSEHVYRYALCLAWLGRPAEAQPFFDRARAMGYRESYELVLVGLPRH